MNYNFHPYFTKEFELTPCFTEWVKEDKEKCPSYVTISSCNFSKKEKWKALDTHAKISQAYLMSNMDPAPPRKCLYFLDSDQIKGYRDDL